MRFFGRSNIMGPGNTMGRVETIEMGNTIEGILCMKSTDASARGIHVENDRRA